MERLDEHPAQDAPYPSNVLSLAQRVACIRRSWPAAFAGAIELTGFYRSSSATEKCASIFKASGI